MAALFFMRYTQYMKLFTKLKHLFIPHHGNDFKPHIFRETAVFVMLFVSVFLLGVSFGSSHFIHKTVLGATIASSVLVDLTNESRIASNQVPLRKNDKLEKAAQLKGEDMIAKGYFAHDSPEGLTPWHWLREVGYTFLYAGENLAINFSDASDVEKAWLDSPKHRANILNAEFREIGIATVPGVYNNAETIYVVQMFGTPAYAEVSESALPILTVPEKKNVVLVDATSTASSTLSGVIAGDVKGDSTETNPSLQNISGQGGVATVKNNNAQALTEEEKLVVPLYSTWYDKIIFNGSRYIDTIYKSLLALIVVALLVMIVVEIRRQHIKHIFYAVALLILLQLFIYINQSFF